MVLLIPSPANLDNLGDRRVSLHNLLFSTLNFIDALLCAQQDTQWNRQDV